MAIPQVQNDPAYRLPFLYISGLNLSIASTTVLAIASGQARDSSDNIDMPVGLPDLNGNVGAAPLLINTAVNGANGLDSGSILASNDYAVYLIGDSRYYKPVAGILSLTSNVAPLLPLGYDSYRLLGFVQANASGNLVAGTGAAANPLNAVNLRCYSNSPAVSVLSAGNATSFTAVALTSGVPTTTAKDVILSLQVTFIPAAAGDTAQLRPSGEGTPQTANLPTIVGQAAGVAQTQLLSVIAGVSGGQPSIDYKVSASGDSLSLNVLGYCYIPTSYVP